jgi:two-component sensor histidine kinase
MTAPDELARDLTGLDTASRQHLARLVACWGLLSDLSFSDLLLYVPSDEYSLAVSGLPAGSAGLATATRGLRFVVLGQMRPTTNQTLFQSDQVGDLVAASSVPLVREAWERATITTGEWNGANASASTRVTCIPVRFKGEVVGVMCRIWSPTAGRQRGRLERAYLQIFESLARMVAAGIYPFLAEEEAEDPPRVGDGVIVLDATQRVQFASPNAINAFHRMGVVAVTGGELGFAPETVASAFALRMPIVEEIERRPDVTVLVNCIPLIEEGGVIGAAVLLRDVSELRRRDRLLLSKDAAIREVHHRVKNNLQTISSLLRLQSRRLEDPAARDALLEAEHRIRAIAAVHEVLASKAGDQVQFEETVPTLLELARDANVSAVPVELEVVGQVGEIAGDLATPLALVIAELLRNAVEHAFESDAANTIAPRQVVLRFSTGDARLVVEVADNGSGFPAGFDIDDTRSLGLAIVRDLVRSQLGGSITIKNDGGALVRLDVPLHPTD